MRIGFKNMLAEQNADEIPFDESTMDFWVDNFGSTAAAWLIYEHRAQIHEHGAVDFKIPKSKEPPAWFKVAMEKLRRSSKWSVTMTGAFNAPEQTFRVRWHHWGREKRN